MGHFTVMRQRMKHIRLCIAFFVDLAPYVYSIITGTLNQYDDDLRSHFYRILHLTPYLALNLALNKLTSYTKMTISRHHHCYF